MGTKVQCKSYLPGYYSMRDLNEDSNSNLWPLFYGDRTLTNGQYCNGFLPRTVPDAYQGYDKDVLKQKMLEHEATFKNQVYELHRLYRTQRNMMDEIKRKELYKHRMPIEISSSTTPLASQIPSEDAWKWKISNLPFANSVAGSPPSCTKGNTIQANPVPPENGFSSKDCEVLESRPSKVRKKLFDLQLPADEYIDSDEGENSRENKISDISMSLPNGNHKIPLENGGKLFLGDLNDPIHVEETTIPTSVDFLGSGEIGGLDLSANPKSLFVGPSKEIFRNLQYGSSNGTTSSDMRLQNIGNGRDWLSYTYEAWHSKSNLNSFSQAAQPDKFSLPSQPIHITPNNVHQHPRFLHTDHKRDPWREGTGHALGITERNGVFGEFNHIPSPYPFVNSSDFSNVRSQSITSWENRGISVTEKLLSVQTHPSLNSSPYSFKVGIDHLNCKKDDNLASEHSENYGNCSNVRDLKNVVLLESSCNEVRPRGGLEIIDLERNYEDCLAVLPWLRANEATNMRKDLNSAEMSFLGDSSRHLTIQSEKAKDSNQNCTQNLTSCDGGGGAKRNEKSECLGSRKILGFPIFENLCTSNTNGSCILQGGTAIRIEGKNGEIDINLAFDPTFLVVEKEVDTQVAKFRNDFDLNSSMSEDEIPSIPSVQSTNTKVKIALEIDLEAPAVPEIEEDFLPGEEKKNDGPHDEVVRIAAEAIVAISSSDHLGHTEKATCHPSDDSLEDTFLWFVEVVSNFTDDLETKLVNEIDEFEAMTLELADLKEEEYMPKPVAPEYKEMEEVGPTTVSNRTIRKGPTRRGRQRRDFQREILPGLASLSRHEVTEDIQTFGGLMRATGHSWNSGLTRRSGARNARRRSVADHDPAPVVAVSTMWTPLIQQLNSIEVGLEDRSLKGWGKTTRRPRRPRWPAGNHPPMVPLSL